MNENQIELIKKIYALWEIDRLHLINECYSIKQEFDMVQELDAIKAKINKEFNINLS